MGCAFGRDRLIGHCSVGERFSGGLCDCGATAAATAGAPAPVIVPVVPPLPAVPVEGMGAHCGKDGGIKDYTQGTKEGSLGCILFVLCFFKCNRPTGLTESKFIPLPVRNPSKRRGRADIRGQIYQYRRPSQMNQKRNTFRTSKSVANQRLLSCFRNELV